MSVDYLVTKGLSVGYNGRALIEEIDLDIQKGEIVTLIGPNGSGKSTILKSITRQLQLIAGTVVIDGKTLTSLPYKELATRMAVVLTERIKPELMTCRDIVSTGRYPYTGRLGILSPEDEEKVSEAMETVHTLELEHRDFGAISDGQRQRVLLARAICQEPEIIILDEPTSFLDIRHKLELLEILRSMAKARGITVVMSLHEIDLAQKISDRVLCVKGTRIARFGPPYEVFDEDTVRELYEIDKGCYDPLFGSVELPRPQGEPGTLVLSSCGSGVPAYRALQKAGIPFIAGVLWKNDADFFVARHLASRVIAEEPFRPLSDPVRQEALDAVSSCDAVIDAGVDPGALDAGLREIVNAAERAGKLKSLSDLLGAAI